MIAVLVLVDEPGGTEWLGTLHVVALFGRVLGAGEMLTIITPTSADGCFAGGRQRDSVQ